MRTAVAIDDVVCSSAEEAIYSAAFVAGTMVRLGARQLNTCTKAEVARISKRAGVFAEEVVRMHRMAKHAARIEDTGLGF
jgi:hypothetical protein